MFCVVSYMLQAMRVPDEVFSCSWRCLLNVSCKLSKQRAYTAYTEHLVAYGS